MVADSARASRLTQARALAIISQERFDLLTELDRRAVSDNLFVLFKEGSDVVLAIRNEHAAATSDLENPTVGAVAIQCGTGTKVLVNVDADIGITKCLEHVIPK